MPPQSASLLLPTHPFDATDNKNIFCSILRTSLGEQAWRKLSPEIVSRFNAHLSEAHSMQFVGRMHWVYCSPIGALIAKIIKPFSILPDICTREADFLFSIAVRNGVIMKQRVYQLSDKHRFVLTSRFADQPRLHEEFGGGIGMYLSLAVKRGAMLFRDCGYFIRLRNWCIRLPRILTVGHFELMHRNIDEQRFQIIIRVAHPWLGTLFYQRGVFRQIGD